MGFVWAFSLVFESRVYILGVDGGKIRLLSLPVSELT